MSLSKRQQSLIKSLFTRHGRKKSDLCICEGLRCCREVFEQFPELLELTVLREDMAEWASKIAGEVQIVGEKEFGDLTATVNAQGILCVVKQQDCSVQEHIPVADPFVLALDKVGDPGNFGTILRTAKAAGLQELWFTRGAVDPFNDKVIRSALGAQFGMRLRGFENLDQLHEFGRKCGYNKVYLTDPHCGSNLFTTGDLFAKTILVIGSEGDGVSDLVDGCRVTIPMPGKFESLNAAQAATIFIFEYVRRISP